MSHLFLTHIRQFGAKGVNVVHGILVLISVRLIIGKISSNFGNGKARFCAKIANQVTIMLINDAVDAVDAVVTAWDFVTIAAFRDC